MCLLFSIFYVHKISSQTILLRTKKFSNFISTKQPSDKRLTTPLFDHTLGSHQVGKGWCSGAIDRSPSFLTGHSWPVFPGWSQLGRSKHASEGSTLALKPRADVTRSPKQGYQWPHKKDSCPPKIKKITPCLTEVPRVSLPSCERNHRQDWKPSFPRTTQGGR